MLGNSYYSVHVETEPMVSVDMSALAGVIIPILLITLAVGILMIVAMWKLFKKAGRPGWPAIVPFYNNWILFEIGGLEGALSLVSLVFPPFIYYGWYKVCKAFGKSTGFFVALIFFPFVCIPILGFGDSVYQKSNNANQGGGMPQGDNMYQGGNMQGQNPFQNGGMQNPNPF